MIFPTWAEIHGALTHFPVALLMTYMLFEACALIFKKPEWRLVSFWLLVVAVASALPTLFTGWNTGSELFGKLTHSPQIFLLHRAMAITTSALAFAALLLRLGARDRIYRHEQTVSVMLSITLAFCVGYVGYLGGRMVFGGAEQANAPAAIAGEKSSRTIADGAAVYANNRCSSCHMINSSGGSMGPDLSHEGTRHPDLSWQIKHLKEPDKITPGSMMPSFANLPNSELITLGRYLILRK